MSDAPKNEAEKAPKPEGEAAEKQEAVAKGPNPWLPVIAVVVLMPVLSFVMMQFVLVPKIKSSVEKTLKSAVDASKHSKEEGESSEHGDQEVYTKTFKNIIANLSGAMQSRYIKISFTLEGKSSNFEEVMDLNEAKIVDATLGILSGLTVSDLEKPGIQNQLRNDLMIAFSNVLQKDIVSQIYFSEFVVQ